MENKVNHEDIINISGLEVVFDGRIVIRDFSLHLGQGEKLLLTGPSGSGKSTLLLCLMGFIRPVKGAIYIDGQRLGDDNIWQLRQNIVWVAQEPDPGKGSVRDVIQRPFSYRANRDLKDNMTKLGEYLRRFRLNKELLDKDVSVLSGGEKQRIALITAILLQRPIILLDEPSSALDQTSKQAVMDFLVEAKGLSILAVSHDRDWAGCVDRVERIGSEDRQ